VQERSARVHVNVDVGLGGGVRAAYAFVTVNVCVLLNVVLSRAVATTNTARQANCR
jgi:hypothetical protein